MLMSRGVRFNDRKVVIFAIFTSILLSFTFFTLHAKPSIATEWLPKPQKPHKPSSPGVTHRFTPPPVDPKDPDLVRLDYLSVRPHKSKKNMKHVKYYWNMPYAASAGGENRFRGPQPPGLYNETLEWNEKLAMCPNIQRIDESLRNDNVEDETVRGLDADRTEDCLNLNVFAPIDAKPGDELPVCVVIPGGGFHIPGRSNGGAMVEKTRVEKKDGTVEFKGIVVVTMGYRNGIYGFLSGEEIGEDGDFNNGIRDQRASLEWVQKYIRYFGGNPDHVVVMGTSAGGASALLHMTANEGDHTFSTPGTGQTKLFHGVVAQSPASPTFYTPEQAQKFWKQVALGVNCTNLSVECVRNASVHDLYWNNFPMSFPGRNNPPHWMWSPTTEPKGGFLTEPATSAILGGRYAKIPTIFGYTTNEGTDQVGKGTDDEGTMRSFLKDHYPLLTDADLDEIVKMYPNEMQWPDSGKYWDSLAKAQGDMRYVCPTYLASNAMAKHNPGAVKTWQYQWDVAASHDITNGYGTKHAGSVGHIMSPPRNEISDYVMSFIKHLDPNVERAAKTPEWPALDMTEPQKARRVLFSNMKWVGEGDKKERKQKPLSVTIEESDPVRAKRCELTRKLGPRLQQAPLQKSAASPPLSAKRWI